MEVISFEVCTSSGQNIMDPKNHYYKGIKKQFGREPLVSDFSLHHQELYGAWLIHADIRSHIASGIPLYIKINHGSRNGSIVKVNNLHEMYADSDYHGYLISWDFTLELEFDDGKIIKMKGPSLFYDLKKEEYGELLIGYEGPTVFKFTKNKRVIEPPADLYDTYGRKIEIGDWVMNRNFHVGKIIRISPKGTMWVDYLKTDHPRCLKGYMQLKNSRELAPDEFIKVNISESNISMVQIMDYDVSNFPMEINIDFKST